MKKTSAIIMALAITMIFASCTPKEVTVAPESVGLSGDTLEVALQKMQGYIDNHKQAGISVMVIKDGKTALRENFGFADIENKMKIKDNTIFRIYSMSKPVTAAALMTLYDEGKFDLDDKISKHIPDFEWAMVYSPELGTHFLDFQNEEMSIRNLLTHTSGIPYGWDPNSFVDSIYRAEGIGKWDQPLGSMVKKMARMPLKTQPGTKWEYGLSIDIAGYLVEVFSGMPLDEYFRTRIFEPLKMDDTGFFVPEESQKRFAEVYHVDKEGNLVKNVNPEGDSFRKPTIHFSGGGGLVSTMDDYARFCQMLVNGGELDGVRILKESTARMIMSDQLPAGVAYRDGYGYGLAGEVNLETGEYGWAGAASTKFWIDGANNMIVITMAQLLPNNYDYANEFRKMVGAAIIK